MEKDKIEEGDLIVWVCGRLETLVHDLQDATGRINNGWGLPKNERSKILKEIVKISKEAISYEKTH